MEDEELDLFSLKGMKKKKKKTQKREKEAKAAVADTEGQVAPALSDADNRAILEDDEELDIFKIKRKRKKATPGGSSGGLECARLYGASSVLRPSYRVD